MSDNPSVRHIVTNVQSQPVELHLGAGVVVLRPGESREIREVDVGNPQLQVLRRNRLITLRTEGGSVPKKPPSKSSGGAKPKPEA